MSEIEVQVKHIIGQVLDRDPYEISKEMSFINDLGADSLDLVELVMAIEEEFNIEILDEDANNMSTVYSVVDYLESRL